MRESGYYWVRGKAMIGGDWEIMYFDSEIEKWYVIGDNPEYSDFFIKEINETRIKNPDEKEEK